MLLISILTARACSLPADSSIESGGLLASPISRAINLALSHNQWQIHKLGERNARGYIIQCAPALLRT